MKIEITITKTSESEIDVRDSAGIRLMLLNERDNKGLYTYFVLRLEQPEASCFPMAVPQVIKDYLAARYKVLAYEQF